MNTYRIDLTTEARSSSRFWIDAPFAAAALVLGYIEARRRHRRIDHAPLKSFSVTRCRCGDICSCVSA